MMCACGMYSDILAMSTLLCCMLSYTGIKLSQDSVVGHLSVCASAHQFLEHHSLLSVYMLQVQRGTGSGLVHGSCTLHCWV